jgi:hypothetical protein
MDTDLAKQFFLSAHARHDHARRWRRLALVLGLAFHALVFSRYVAAKFGQRTAQERLGVLTLRTSELEALCSKLTAFSDSVSRQVDAALSDELKEIRADFEELNRVIEWARAPAAAGLSVEELEVELWGWNGRAERRGEAEERPDIRQLPTGGRGETRPNVAQAPALENDIALVGRGRLTLEASELATIRAAPPERWNAVLGPIVEARIVTPRFDELNRRWRELEVGALRGRSAEVVAGLRAAAAQDATRAGELEALAARVGASVEALGAYTFVPPASPEWWRTVEAKVASMESLADRAQGYYAAALGSPHVVDELRSAANDARAQQQRSLEEFRTECERLSAQFAKQSAALATLGKPFEFLAADLDFVAARWPLILGLLLAGACVWRGLADREFVEASELAAANGSTAVAASLSQWTQRGARPASALALASLGAAWIALAGWQLRRAPMEADATDPLTFAAFGIAALVCAQVWRVRYSVSPASPR